MTTHLQPGDPVRHVAGGPLMTVETAGRVHVRCVYFVGNRVRRRDCTRKELVLAPRPAALPTRFHHRWRPTRVVYWGRPKDDPEAEPVIIAKRLRCQQCGTQLDVVCPHVLGGTHHDFDAPILFTAPCPGGQG